MKLNKIKIACLCAFVLSCGALNADIRMPEIFGDNMVLQRQEKVKIWGQAEAGAVVKVEFFGQKVSTKAGENGNWSVRLSPMKADKTSREMKVYENGKLQKTFKNILVGEVWILGGQSNMEWTLRKTTQFERVKSEGEKPLIRFFIEPNSALAEQPQFFLPKGSKWITFDLGKSAISRSGVGYYFAEALLADLGVPVGLIDTPLGGSAMRTWIPEERFGENAFLSDCLKDFKKQKASYNYEKAMKKYKEGIAKWQAEVAEAKKHSKKAPEKPWALRSKPSPISPQRAQGTPSYLYNAKIAPIASYTARGFLWYQGESDANKNSLPHFESQFEILIDSWRNAWEKKDMPFIFVQLASFTTASDWAKTRSAQAAVSKKMKNVHMANIIDCGEEKDIHPKDKTTVGVRLEKLAMNKVYGKSSVLADAPDILKVSYKGSSAIARFNTYGSALEGRGDARGFEIFAGGKWKQCKAKLMGPDSVELSSPDGEKIEGVRYLWKNWARPDVWLYNAGGLPAVSFSCGGK